MLSWDGLLPRAFILAGGLGTRLRTVTGPLPKAMVPVCGRPFIEWLIERLVIHGLPSITLCVGYRSEAIIECLSGGDALGATITCSHETSALGTGGALGQALSHVSTSTVALNGDSWFPISYARLFKGHSAARRRNPKTVATLALGTASAGSAYGTVEMERDGYITAFREKPAGPTSSKYVNGGVYVVEPELVDFIPQGAASSLEYDVFPDVLASGFQIHAMCFDSAIRDIGTPERLYSFERYLLEHGIATA